MPHTAPPPPSLCVQAYAQACSRVLGSANAYDLSIMLWALVSWEASPAPQVAGRACFCFCLNVWGLQGVSEWAPCSASL